MKETKHVGEVVVRKREFASWIFSKHEGLMCGVLPNPVLQLRTRHIRCHADGFWELSFDYIHHSALKEQRNTTPPFIHHSSRQRREAESRLFCSPNTRQFPF